MKLYFNGNILKDMAVEDTNRLDIKLKIGRKNILAYLEITVVCKYEHNVACNT